LETDGAMKSPDANMARAYTPSRASLLLTTGALLRRLKHAISAQTTKKAIHGRDRALSVHEVESIANVDKGLGEELADDIER
jgi:hypothetical protein